MTTIPKNGLRLLVALGGLILIALVVRQAGPRRTLYAGKDAIYWSRSLTGNSSQRTNAEHALRVMGAAGAHDLADVLQVKAKIKDRFMQAVGKRLPGHLNWTLLRLTGVLDPQVYPAMAARGLEVAGSAARDVIPEMEAAIPVSNSDVYLPLIRTLMQIKPEGFLTLGRILRHGEETRQRCVANEIRSLGTNALPLLPDLIYLITNQQPAAASAALAIASIGEPALPAVTSLLAATDQNLVLLAVLTLRNMGPFASAAVSNLIPLAMTGNREMRSEAIRAIGSIDPNQSKCLALLKTAAIDRDPAIRLAAIDALQNAPHRVWRDRPLFDALASDLDPQVRARAQIAFGEKNPLSPIN